MCLLADHKERMAFTLGKELLFFCLAPVSFSAEVC